MPYATVAAITNRYGDDFLYPIADRDNDDTLDTTTVENALADASSLIDSYLSTRYPLPLVAFPDLLQRLCVDIAVYWLAKDGETTEEKRQRYADALAWLERIATGKVALNITDSERTTPMPAISATRVRLFSRATLQAF